LSDWGEAANGGPHGDWASLLADARGRGFSVDWVEPMAREALGGRFAPRRFAWQWAAAEARRVVEALQRARTDWRDRALDALAAAERTLPGSDAPPATRAPPAAPPPRAARA